MGTTSFPETPLNADLERVIINLNTMAEELDHVFGGKIDTKNIREIAGWIATRYKLQSKDGDVGFNTEDTGSDDIRIWAGDTLGGTPKFTVTKGGILTAIAALFASSTGYPRVEMNSADGSIGAYQAADSYLEITPDAFGSTPGILMQSIANFAQMFLSNISQSLIIITPAGNSAIQISSGKDLDLSCNSGYHVKVKNWSTFQMADNGNTLQQELDILLTKANTNMVNISSLFAYCNNLDMRLTAIGG